MTEAFIIAASLVLAAHIFGPLPKKPVVAFDVSPPVSGTVAWIFINSTTKRPLDNVIHLSRWVVRNDLLCEAVVHEYGHLKGLHHRRTGIMRPALEAWPGCDKVTNRRQHD